MYYGIYPDMWCDVHSNLEGLITDATVSKGTIQKGTAKDQ